MFKTRDKKLALAVTVPVTLLLALSGCTDAGTADGKKAKPAPVKFDSVQLTETPTWDLEGITAGVLNATGGEDDEDNSGDILNTSYISFGNPETGCRVTGAIVYTEAYREGRGDEFNSKDYLYNLVPPTQNPVTGEKVETINNVEYVVGAYTQPEDWGPNPNHRTAVRVFSSPVAIEGGAVEEGTTGDYNTDLSVGLPTVTLDYSCPADVELDDAEWKTALKNFKLVLPAEKVKN